jgi:RNase adaptor protein for sRNA GlmZ degradation
MKIITFGFVREQPPAEATAVIDCRLLADSDPSKPANQAKLAEARRHVARDAVIAFGCGFGEQRSVNLASKLAEEVARRFPVEVEHRSLNRRYHLTPADVA